MPAESATPEQSHLLSDSAFRLIRKAIVTHELKPGEKVSEATLTKRFDLSRAAVRSALSRLATERLILAPSPKKQIVAPLTLSDVHAAFHVRNLLEPEAAKLAAGKLDEKILNTLDEICQLDYKFGNHDQEYAFLEANSRFHVAIAKASGNPFHADFIERIHSSVSRIMWVSLQIENRASVWRHGHEDIIDALVRGDGEAARKRAEVHLVDGQRLVYEVLSGASSLSDVPLSLQGN